MAVQDLWHSTRGERTRCPDCRSLQGPPTARHGTGKRWRVIVPGHPSRAFTVKADAQQWERELWAEAPRDGRPGRLTIATCVATYLAGKAHRSTGYTSSLKGAAQHVLDQWADTDVTHLTHSDIQAWTAGLQAEYGPKLEGGKRALQPMAVNSRKRVLQVLRGALNVAIERGAITRNPAEGIDPGRAQKRMPVFLTTAQIKALATAAREYGPMIWLLATTGVRLGECRRLNVEDVDTARRRLIVRASKTGRYREVPIPQPVLDMLPLTGPGPLFRAPSGGRLDTDNWRARLFTAARDAVGLPELHVHDLRHTAASLMVASGATVKDVQAALGHSSAAMTLDVYAHLFDGSLDDVGVRMGKLLGGA